MSNPLLHQPQRPGLWPTTGATAEETERLLAWLERPEVRLVECPGWAYPARGAARFGVPLDQAEGRKGANLLRVDE